MTNTSTIDALNALATGNTARSETAKLRDVFDAVENALKAGVRREAILETLKKDGINLSHKGFDSAITRIRKERKKNQNTAMTQKGSTNSDSSKQLKTPNPEEPENNRRQTIKESGTSIVKKPEIDLSDFT